MKLKDVTPREQDLNQPNKWIINIEDTRNNYERFKDYPNIQRAFWVLTGADIKKIKLIARTTYKLGIPIKNELNKWILSDFIKNVPKVFYEEGEWLEELEQFKEHVYESVIGLFQLAILQEDYKQAAYLKPMVQWILDQE